MDTKTILVVEDDDDTRNAFGTALGEYGYKVALAHSGKEGLQYLQTHTAPDIIILDMLLPGFDGWGFIRERNRQWSSVPILIVTALSIASDAWAASLGACSWLAKPVDPAVVLERVQTYLGSRDGN